MRADKRSEIVDAVVSTWDSNAGHASAEPHHGSSDPAGRRVVRIVIRSLLTAGLAMVGWLLLGTGLASADESNAAEPPGQAGVAVNAAAPLGGVVYNATDPLGRIAQPVTQAAQPVTQVAQPVTQVVDQPARTADAVAMPSETSDATATQPAQSDPLAQVAQPLQPVLHSVVQPVADTVQPITDPVADSVAGIVEPVAAPVLGSILQPVFDTARPIANAATVLDPIMAAAPWISDHSSDARTGAGWPAVASPAGELAAGQPAHAAGPQAAPASQNVAPATTLSSGVTVATATSAQPADESVAPLGQPSAVDHGQSAVGSNEGDVPAQSGSLPSVLLAPSGAASGTAGGFGTGSPGPVAAGPMPGQSAQQQLAMAVAYAWNVVDDAQRSAIKPPVSPD